MVFLPPAISEVNEKIQRPSQLYTLSCAFMSCGELAKYDCWALSRALDSVGLGWAQVFAFSIVSKMRLRLKMLQPHFENCCSILGMEFDQNSELGRSVNRAAQWRRAF